MQLRKRFRDTKVVLDGEHFVECTFERCSLIYGGGRLPLFDGGTIDSCNWQLTDAARRTIQFLMTLRELGAPDVVDQVIDQLRHPKLPANEA